MNNKKKNRCPHCGGKVKQWGVTMKGAKDRCERCGREVNLNDPNYVAYIFVLAILSAIAIAFFK